MADGVKTRLSRYSFEETVERLESVLKERGIKLFSVIDHSGEARAVGLRMPATQVLIFGSPKAGTPVMLAAPSVALDLPLKVLVAQTDAGEVALSWNDAAWLEQRHGFPADMTPALAAVDLLVAKAAG